MISYRWKILSALGVLVVLVILISIKSSSVKDDGHQLLENGSEEGFTSVASAVLPTREEILTSQLTDYYVYGDQVIGPTYGDIDRWGIEQSVLDQYHSRIEEFRTIGTAFADRRAWMQSNGKNLPNDVNWMVDIASVGTVNQQLRVLVIATVGKIVLDERGTDAQCFAGLSELWSITEGAAPQLLERSDLPFNQLYTHQESPVTRVPIDRLIGNPIDIGGGKTIPAQTKDSTNPTPAPPLP